MHKHVLHIRLIRLLVDLRRNPCKSFITNIRLYRVKTLYKHVDPKVKLPLVQQQRVIHIMLHQQLLAIPPSGNIFYRIDQEDSFASPAFGRLGYIKHVWIVFHVFLKQILLFRQQVAQRCELKVLAKVLLHPIHDVTQNLLPWKQLRAGISVDMDLRSWADNVDVWVSQSHAVPNEVAITVNFGLLPAVEVNDVLEGLSFVLAMASVHDEFCLLFGLCFWGDGRPFDLAIFYGFSVCMELDRQNPARAFWRGATLSGILFTIFILLLVILNTPRTLVFLLLLLQLLLLKLLLLLLHDLRLHGLVRRPLFFIFQSCLKFIH